MWWRYGLAGISVAISAIAICVRFGLIEIDIMDSSDLPAGMTPIMVGDQPLAILILAVVTIAGVIPLALTLFQKRS